MEWRDWSVLLLIKKAEENFDWQYPEFQVDGGCFIGEKRKVGKRCSCLGHTENLSTRLPHQEDDVKWMKHESNNAWVDLLDEMLVARKVADMEWMSVKAECLWQ